MPRFDFNSMILDGKSFQIVDRSVKLKLATQAEAFTYKRQPRQGAVKISNNDLKAIQEALAASTNKKLTISLLDTNGTKGNFVNSDNIASFTGRILSTSKAGNNLSIQALTNQLQKSFNKLSSRPIYNADQVNEESVDPSPSPTPPTPDPEPSPNPTPTPTPSGEGDGGGSPAPTFIVTATNYGTQGGSKYTFSGTATGLITLTGNQTQYTFTRAALARPQTPNIGAGEAFIELDQNAASVDASQYTGTNAIALNFSFQGPGNANITGSPIGDGITGGAGADTITGGAGGDVMAGGAGVNVYRFYTGDVVAGEALTLTGTTDSFDVVTTTVFDAMNGGGAITGLDDINITEAQNAEFLSAQLTGLTLTVDGAGGGITETLIVDASLNTGVTINLGGATLSNATSLIRGGTGNDTITGTNANDTITGGAGVDSFQVLAGTDTITDLGTGGNDEIDVAAGATANATITAGYTAGANSSNAGILNATAGAALTSISSDQISFENLTGSGVRLTGNNNGVWLKGSAQADTITGGSGSDRITGGAGGDSLASSTGENDFYFYTNDVAAGEVVSFNGDDRFLVASSTVFDLMNAGNTLTGLDEILINTGGGGINAEFLSDQITGLSMRVNSIGTGQKLIVDASSNGGVIINLSGINMNTDIGTTNWVTGSITGGSGNDTITGTNARDTITGDAGADNLTGGASTDIFAYTTTTQGTDTITDFTVADDDFGLKQTSFGMGIALGQFPSGNFSTAVNASDVTLTGTMSNKAVRLTTSQTTSDLTAAIANGAFTAIVIAHNSDLGYAQLYYDSDWGDTGGRRLLANLTSLTSLSSISAIDQSNFIAT